MIEQETENDLYKVKINLSKTERKKCLTEIIKKNKKILYAYEQSQLPETNYNYKMYIGGLLIYVSSSNVLFNGELINILINLNAIMTNNFDKKQIKKIVHETTNIGNFLLEKEGDANGDY